VWQLPSLSTGDPARPYLLDDFQVRDRH
jgi:hypothetical protein